MRLVSLVALAWVAGCAADSIDDRRAVRYRPSADDRNVAQWREPGTDKTGGGPRVGPGKTGTGAASTNAAVDVPAWMQNLQRGDKVAIYLAYGGGTRPEEKLDVIDEEGKINLPLIGRVKIDGISRSEAQTAVERAYIDGGIYRNISVTILVKDEDVFVDGEVRRPGRQPFTAGMTLLRAISAGGGYTEYGDATDVKIIRGKDILPANARKIEDGKEKDIVLKPGDLVKVERKIFL